jgi:hypothetical protein
MVTIANGARRCEPLSAIVSKGGEVMLFGALFVVNWQIR